MSGTESHPIAERVEEFDGSIPTWRVETLTRGGIEAQIVHDGSIYRLRITSNRKLILTK